MNSNIKKTLNILLKVITWLLVAVTVFMMIFTIVTVSTVDRNDRSLFGLKFYIVLTDSMSKSDMNADMDVHFNAGDIVFVKNVKEPTKLQPGDIIAFMSTNNDNYGETITHMIREVKKTGDGKVLGYVTYGTNTGVDDEALVEPSYVLGKYAGKLPGVGNFFVYLKTTPGYIICILIPFLLLILYNGINVIRLFRRYKREQTEIIEAEKAEIAAERKQNEEMMRELLALKEQLARQTAPETAPEAATEVSPEETSEESPEKIETDPSAPEVDIEIQEDTSDNS